MRVRVYLSFVLFAAATFGCQRLNDERTFHLPAGGIQSIEYSAPRFAQKLTIDVVSPGAPVTAYVVKQDESEAAKTTMDAGKAPAAPLVGKESAEEIHLETTVPAKTGYTLLIRADKKSAEVRVKVTGR